MGCRMNTAAVLCQESTPRAERAASQAQEECEAILDCAGSPPGVPLAAFQPRGGADADAADEGLQPGKRQRMGMRQREPGHSWSMADMEDLGGDAHGPQGPHYGRSAVWDGGGNAQGPGEAATAAPEQHGGLGTPAARLGVFAGISQESDFDWGQVSSVPRLPDQREQPWQGTEDSFKTPHAVLGNAADNEVVMDSGSEQDDGERGGRQLPQVDGADDVSDEDDLHTAATGQQEASRGLATASQGQPRATQRAAASDSQGSSQRYGLIPLMRASPSTASAPAMLPGGSQADSKGASIFFDDLLIPGLMHCLPSFCFHFYSIGSYGSHCPDRSFIIFVLQRGDHPPAVIAW